MQRTAVIVADGGVDLPEGFAAQYEIRTIPLMLSFGSEELHSGVDISAEAFYKRLRVDPHHPTTSQPSVGDYVQLYQEAGKAGLPILSFHLSVGLSGSFRSAQLAREMLPHLEIIQVDTGTLSGAMGLQVLVAADMAVRGEPIPAILAEAKRIGEMTDILYTLETVEYLRRGGRIGRVAGTVAGLLGIRPVITVDKGTGTYVSTGRVRSFRAGMNMIVDQIAEQAGEGAEISAIVLHGDCMPEVERLLDRLKARLNVKWLHIVRANPALGVHVGPDTVGVAYYRGLLPISGAAMAEILP
ncbi:MAG TPA: DegV family protein [Symbiobacteriaceae bacterium]|nr:DegV family protein [Symbiobacteriaceae bacterium]